MTSWKKENYALRLQIDQIEQSTHARKVVLGGKRFTSFIDRSEDDLKDSSEIFLSDVLGLERQNINLLHVARLGPYNSDESDRRPVLIEVDDSYTKVQIFQKVIKMKQNDLYVAEFLTKRRKQILDSLLTLKKANPTKISRVYSKHGTVYMQMANSHKPRKIMDQDDLDRCAKQVIASLRWSTQRNVLRSVTVCI